MKPHPRTLRPYIRKTIKWGGPALAALLIAVWAASLRSYWVRKDPRGWIASLCGGVVEIDRFSLGSPLQLWSGSRDELVGGMAIWSGGIPANPITLLVRVHVLPVALVVAAVTACSWCLDIVARRRAADLTRCPRSRYDRTGLAAGAACPECGAAARAAAAARS